MTQTRSTSIRIASIVLAVLLSSAAGWASEVPSESIPWEQASPIDWSFFRGTAPSDAAYRSEAAAIHMTLHWHVSYAVSSSGGDWRGSIHEVTVTNTVEPAQSWVVVGKARDSVLAHEQTHFDLNEVYRRKLECLLSSIQCAGGSQQDVLDSLDSQIRQTAAVLLAKVSEMQAQYDDETSHGSNASMQAYWNQQVLAWLDEPTTAP